MLLVVACTARAMAGEAAVLPSDVLEGRPGHATLLNVIVRGVHDQDVREHPLQWSDAVLGGTIANPSIRAHIARLLLRDTDLAQAIKLRLSALLIANYSRFDTGKARVMLGLTISQIPSGQDLSALSDAVYQAGWKMEPTWMDMEAFCAWQNRPGNPKVETIGRPAWRAPSP